MSLTDNYLENIHEGKIWDKVKKVWRDHKGKIIGGVAAVGAAGAAYAGKKELDKRKAKKVWDHNQAKQRDAVNVLKAADKKNDTFKSKASVAYQLAKYKTQKKAKQAGNAVKGVAKTTKDYWEPKVKEVAKNTKDYYGPKTKKVVDALKKKKAEKKKKDDAARTKEAKNRDRTHDNLMV